MSGCKVWGLTLQSGPVGDLLSVRLLTSISSREATLLSLQTLRSVIYSRNDPILVIITLRFGAKLLGSFDLFCRPPCPYFLLALNLGRQFARVHYQWWLPGALPITAFLSIMGGGGDCLLLQPLEMNETGIFSFIQRFHDLLLILFRFRDGCNLDDAADMFASSRGRNRMTSGPCS